MNEPDALRELLLRWQDLHADGKAPTAEDLCATCPDLAPKLRDRIKAVLAMEAMIGLETKVQAQAVYGNDKRDANATPNGSLSTPASVKVRCPCCQNPIHLGKESDEILCPGCGSSFRLRDARYTETTAGMKSLGKFQLLERLGLGGFGAVWKARDGELDRIVALKIPHTGLLTEREDFERFQREARAAANLRHPNIVCVHEVATLNGLPVIVAEFVPGVPLKDLLDTRRLTFRQAAAFIAEVADALDYAHSLGVVHRDVKPANIMILRDAPASIAGDSGAGPSNSSSENRGELDDVGKPMLLDFGLALRDAVETTMTVDGHVLGTPAYMSPEQAAGQSHRADRRSDVYSLGVILYQMLTGELPFRGSRSMMIFQVMHEEPSPPRKVNDRIPRDLETICLKCLAKAPAARYSSAKELANDLRRFLAGEAILARPIGVFERIGRWCRRKPGLAAASGAAILGLLTALITMASAVAIVTNARDDALHVAAEKEKLNRELTQANADEKKARDEAATQKNLAAKQQKAAEGLRLRAEEAEFISVRLISGFESTDPLGISIFAGSMPGGKQAYAPILDFTSKRILNDLTLSPLMRAKFLDTIGNGYRILGQYTKARHVLQEALDIRENHPNADPLDRAVTLHNFGWVNHELGNYDRAFELYSLALKIRMTQATPNEKLIGASQLNQAWVLIEMGKHADAETILKDLIERRRRTFGEDHRETAQARLALAATYLDAQRFLEAFPLAKQGIEPLLKQEGNNSLAAAFGKFQDAIVQSAVFKNHASAEKALVECVALARKGLGERHIYVGVALYSLATTRIALNKWDDAEADLRECVSIGRELAGMAHPKVRVAVRTFAQILRQRGKAEEATALFQEMLQAQSERFGPDSFLRGESLLDYAAHLEKTSSPAKRLAALQEAAAILRKAPTSQPRFAASLNLLGVAHFRDAQYAKAESCFREAAQRDSKNALFWQNLGNALQRQGSFGEAVAAAQKSLDLRDIKDPARAATEKQLKRSQQMLVLEQRMPLILAKKENASATDLLALAEMANQYKKNYRLAVYLYAAAFNAEPSLTDSVAQQHRYRAACAAVLASTGQGIDAAKLEFDEKVKLRHLAHDWLRAELDSYAKNARKDLFAPVFQVTERLQVWQQSAELASLRDAKGLAILPTHEGSNWQSLWSDVQMVLQRARNRFDETPLQGKLTAKEKSQIHEFPLQARTTYVINMESSDFDTFLKIQHPDGKVLIENDDINPQNLNSRIVFTPDVDAKYRFVATSYQESGVGSYSLRIRSLRPVP